MAKSLNVIGCGRVGRTLTRLWQERGAFEIGAVFDHTPDKSASAVAFIGAGRAVASIGEMGFSDVWMLAPPDDQIVACCTALAAGGALAQRAIVFHLSGALPARDLAPAAALGAHIASVHPLKTFADPAAAILTFRGTYCAAEGDAAALATLRPAFEAIGASVTEIEPRFKTIYHAASVMVSNYLTALLEVGARCYQQAGFTREQALRMMEPLAREALDNVFRLGPAAALTGPIARGDHAIVLQQLEALLAWDPRIATIYEELGAVAVELARAQGKTGPDALAAIERALSGYL